MSERRHLRAVEPGEHAPEGPAEEWEGLEELLYDPAVKAERLRGERLTTVLNEPPAD